MVYFRFTLLYVPKAANAALFVTNQQNAWQVDLAKEDATHQPNDSPKHPFFPAHNA
jgi:hypothetical protein